MKGKRYLCLGTTNFSSHNEEFGISAKNYKEARYKAIRHLVERQSNEEFKWEQDFNKELEVKVKVRKV